MTSAIAISNPTTSTAPARTFGTLRLAKKSGAWEIECEPHVRIRLKRMWAGTARQHQEKLRLADTPEVCADLAWILDRYPLELSPADHAHLFGRARDHRETAAWVVNMLAGHIPPPAFDTAIPLRGYQRAGAAIALKTRGLLIADELGLGKTATAIGIFTDPGTLPGLVVTLTGLVPQWCAEIRRFAPRLQVHALEGVTPYDLTKLHERRPPGRRRAPEGQLGLGLEQRPGTMPDVIVTNYTKLAPWADVLRGNVRSVVFDEAQELRRGNESQKYEAALAIRKRADVGLGLSGTPIHNLGGEIHNVMQVLAPGKLGTRTEFLAEWCKGSVGNTPAIKDPRAFGTYMRELGVMIRRTCAEVGRELPPLMKIPQIIDADPASLHSVAGPAGELARIILKPFEGEKGEKLRASEELSNLLRQATGIAKAKHVADFVRGVIESGERLVLYGWHRAVYDVWMALLAQYKPALYTGSETLNQKEEAKRRFVAGDTPLLIMSLRSGAGLDGLQGSCRTVAFGELDWAYAVHEQCIGRVRRDGQKDPVKAYFLISEIGADPAMAEVLGVKRAQLEGLIDPGGDPFVKIAREGDSNTKMLATDWLRQCGQAIPGEVR